MPKLSQSEFAALVRSMPDASDDQILEAAKAKETEPSLASKVWEGANAPLSDYLPEGYRPEQLGKRAGDKIDQRSLDENPHIAKLRGFTAGALEGAGNVVRGLTSPINVALTALGVGAEAAGARGLVGVSKAARMAEGALQVPMALEGGKEAVEGVQEGDYGKAGAGALMAALAGHGAKSGLTRGAHVPAAEPKAKLPVSDDAGPLSLEARGQANMDAWRKSPEARVPGAKVLHEPSAVSDDAGPQSLAQRGDKNVADWRAQETPAAPLADDRTSGIAFKKFFSDVTNGAEQYRPQSEWKSLLPLEKEQPFHQEYQRHTGNFDDHIATSIPGYRDVQIRKGTALAKTFGQGARMLDIGASEGSFGKTVTAQSGGRIQSVSLDPNPDMANFFHAKSQVPGATYSQEAFHQGFEDGGAQVPAHNPTHPYDIVHEAMVFQFISPERQAHIGEVKRLLSPGGVFLTEEKLLGHPDVWKANEALKDSKFKNTYYSPDALAAKQKVVKFDQDPAEAKSVGMVDNMVSSDDFENILKQHFKHVVQYTDSGNFKGYAASDDAQKLHTLVAEMGDLQTPFSTTQTPRVVGEAAPASGQSVHPNSDTALGAQPHSAAALASPQPPVQGSPAALGHGPSSATGRSAGFPSTESAAGSPSAPVYGLDEAASTVQQLTHEKGGASFSLFKGDLVGTDHYAVAAFPERGEIIQGAVDPAHFKAFIEKNQDLLQDPNNVVGTWFNKADGQTYLDISTTTPSLQEALTLGKAKDQIAIFNLKNLEEIPVSPQLPHEFTPVGDEPAYQRPVLKDPQAPILDKIAQSGGRNPERLAREQAARGQTGPATDEGLPSAPTGPAPKPGQPPAAGSLRPPDESSTGTKVAGLAGPALALYPGKFSDDPEKDAKIRKYLAMTGLTIGAAGFFPKRLGAELLNLKTALKAEHLMDAQVETRIREAIRGKFEDPKQAKYVYDAFNTIELPTNYEGVNFDSRKGMGHVLAKDAADGGVRMSKFSEARLDKAFEVGKRREMTWGQPEWLATLTNWNPDLAVKFARLGGATSPGTPTNTNLAQAAELFVRCVLKGEQPEKVLKTMMTALPVRPTAVGDNVARAVKGGRIYTEKTEILSGAELGLQDRIPIDLWLLRAMGSIDEKTPSSLKNYYLLEDGFRKWSEAKGMSPFEAMATVWQGMQDIVGVGSLSFKQGAERMQLPKNMQHPDNQRYVMDNLPQMSDRLGRGRNDPGDPSIILPKAPQVPVAEGNLDAFMADVHKIVGDSRRAGDVLGKKVEPKNPKTPRRY